MAETAEKVYKIENYFDHMPADATAADWHIEVMTSASVYLGAIRAGEREAAEFGLRLVNEAWEHYQDAQTREFIAALTA